MDYMLTEGDFLGSFGAGDRLAECGLPAPPGGSAGQRWDGQSWINAPDAAQRAADRLAIMARMIEAEGDVVSQDVIAADPIQNDLPIDDARIIQLKTYRDDPKTPDSTSALLDSMAVIGRVLTAQGLMTPEQLDALFAAAMK